MKHISLLAIILASIYANAQLIGNGAPVSPCHVANFGKTIYYTDTTTSKNYYCNTMVTPSVWVEFIQGQAGVWTPDTTIDWTTEAPATMAIISLDADGHTLHCTVRGGGPCTF